MAYSEQNPVSDREAFMAWLSHQREIRDGDLRQVVSSPDQDAVELFTTFEERVLFEDEHLLFLDKLPGVLTHKGTKRHVGVLEIARAKRGEDTSAVHRLDRETSGVILLAKTKDAEEHLKMQFHERDTWKLRKRYVALLDGALPLEELAIEALITTATDTRMRVVREDELSDLRGRIENTKTVFHPVAVLSDRQGNLRTYTDVDLKTGKTHRIRVVASEVLGTPVTGDYLYNTDLTASRRTLLHAYELDVAHPVTHVRVVVRAPIPGDMARITGRMKWEY